MNNQYNAVRRTSGEVVVATPRNQVILNPLWIEEWRNELGRILKHTPNLLLLDMNDVTFFGARALRPIASLQIEADTTSKTVVQLGVSDNIREIFRWSEEGRMFNLSSDLETAIQEYPNKNRRVS
ncbi:MAG: hypothetical protein QF793_04250 [Candidatus Peribacteraceae bacterium]|jgi:anti-anti-sigma regulatory factor|nr:hypothetical protein [Candidatus Peribacteraceae bacterium]|tara:strand:- start:41 stop:415 length:375 start_codon:yes stop_codon:yes gene_type:complete